MSEEAIVPVVSYALLQEPANQFTRRAVREHALVRLKLWPVGPAEWLGAILISDLDAAVASVLNVAKTQLRSALCRDSFADAEFKDPLVDCEDGEDGILKVGCVTQERSQFILEVGHKALGGDVDRRANDCL